VLLATIVRLCVLPVKVRVHHVVLTGLAVIATAQHSANAPQAKQCCVHLRPFLAVITSPRYGVRAT